MTDSGTDLSTFIHNHLLMPVCVCVYVCVCVCVFMCVFMCVCVYVCVSPWTEQRAVFLQGSEGSASPRLCSAASARRSDPDCWAPATNWTHDTQTSSPQLLDLLLSVEEQTSSSSTITEITDDPWGGQRSWWVRGAVAELIWGGEAERLSEVSALKVIW